MDLIEKEISLDMNYLKSFLSIKWDGHYIYKCLSKCPEKKDFVIQKFKKARINDWSNSNDDKSFAPKDSDTFLNFIYTLSIDPFLPYKVNYRNWSIFLKSLDGNISIGGTIKFGEMGKSLKFLDDFFAPSIEYPSTRIRNISNEVNNKFYFHEFESDLNEDENEIEKKILIKPSEFDMGQVIHFGYKKDKPVIGHDKNNNPIRMYDFWQEYKFIIIRPVVDVLFFLNKEDDWDEEKRLIRQKERKKVKQFSEMKENENFKDFKERALKELFIVFVINILGGIEYDFIKREDSFLIKTRYQEPKTKFKVYSVKNFDLKLVGKKIKGITEIYEKPC